MSSMNHMDTSPETGIPRPESHLDVWEQICSEARAIAQKEPVLNELLHSSVIDRESLEEALSYRISRKLGHHAISEPYLHDLFFDVFRADKKLIEQVRRDIVAIDERDAACESVLFPSFTSKDSRPLLLIAWPTICGITSAGTLPFICKASFLRFLP